VDVRHPDRVVGRTTVGSMQSGLYFGYAAMCEGLIARIRAEIGEPARVVATGGFAETLAAETPSIETVNPVLTLVGLRLIYERNPQPPR
jgi:type III pantothenate kinase